MCGICGEWNARGVDPARLDRMNATLSHRGPDDAHRVVVGSAGLAARRLSIQDPVGGRQPLSNEDGSVWAACNGEIYNFRELRRTLETRGHRFATGSDTEVLVHLYEESGADLVDALRGMFAFAIWDAARGRMLLARDRFGQKPLFYWHDGRRLVFGSEIKAVLAGLDRTPALDVEALDDYLSLRFVPSPSTLFTGVRKLPPARVLTWEAGAGDEDTAREPSIRRYWDLAFVPKEKVDWSEAVELADRAIGEAVESHLVSDVPVGALLSGGLDSSVVVSVMAERAREPVRTFAIGVSEQDFDESRFARQVAEAVGTDHREEIVWPDVVGLLPEIVWHLDEPSDPIAACMYHAAELAGRDRKVILTGDGGDEMFAGFDRYWGFSRVDAYAWLPETLRRGVIGPVLDRLPDSAAYKNWVQKARWVHRLSFHEGPRRFAEATLFFRFSDEEKHALYGDVVRDAVMGRDASAGIVEAFAAADAGDDLDRMLHADIETRLVEHSLMLTDRMSMAHGVEARAPFLDHHLAEAVARLPVRHKMRGRKLKPILRAIAKRHLPASIHNRPKQGFMLPIAYWMRGPLADSLRMLPERSVVVEAGLFGAAGLSRLVEEHLSGTADHHVRLWMVLNVEVWHRLFYEGQTRDQVREWLSHGVEPR